MEETLHRLLFNAAVEIEEEMTEENYIRMDQQFTDIEILSRNMMENQDAANEVWQNVTIVHEMLTSDLQYHILDLDPGKRTEIANAINDSVENDEINELERRIRDIVSDSE
ncbi:hypothetical protein BBEV_2533 [Salisediminibacterium beveridgei]|uniref:Uncharacterized protein n=1 Tax=Salisediminibacterium beveridgei TaxID=632773 RepID=A0A1D7QXZ1_9BACI|nr:hypothetical protein BBEV_2533 [Salisediminibacterium beveridgei]